MPFQPRSYPLVNMPEPQPVNLVGSLADLMQLESAQEVLKQHRQQSAQAERQQASQQAIETAISEARGDVPKAIGSLEGAGRWSEANLLKGKLDEIRTEQQKTFAESLKASGEAFKVSTSLMQGVKAAESPEEQARLFTAARPKIVETLPFLGEYIPESLADDPGFVDRAIAFGLSASELAASRAERVTTLNQTWKQAGDALTRDTAIIETLGPWIRESESAEDVAMAMDAAESAYGASPALIARVRSHLPQPLTSQPFTATQKERLLNSLREPEKVPKETPDRTLVQTMGPDGKPVWTRRSDAVGKPVPATAPASTISQAQIAAAERWKQNQVASLDQRRRDLAGTRTPMTEAEYAQATAGIESSYQRQTGGAATAGGAPGGGDLQAQVKTLLANEPPGTYTLTDGSVWTKAADGTITQKGG